MIDGSWQDEWFKDWLAAGLVFVALVAVAFLSVVVIWGSF